MTPDAGALAAELRRRTSAEVRFDPGSRALYATDASNYRQVPIGVVVPRSLEDVVETVAVCREHEAPVLGRGGGTSLAGQCCNVAVVIDFSRHLHRLLELDPDARTARVEPGLILDELRARAAPHGLTFGPDPATHSHCTLGGMIGNDSCGVHSVAWGKTSDNVLELEILTYDGQVLTVGPTEEEELDRLAGEGGRRGEIYAGLRALRDRYGDRVRDRYPPIPRRVSGYNLDRLLPECRFDVARALVGSESTCALVLGAKVRLVPEPPHRVLVAFGYPGLGEAGDHVPAILRHRPEGLEGMDEPLVANVRRRGMHRRGLSLLPEGNGWLLVELAGGSPEEARHRALRLIEEAAGEVRGTRLLDHPEDQARMWAVRKSALGVTARVPGWGDTEPGWEDSAVPPRRLGGYLRDLRGLLGVHGLRGVLYGHFGEGCVHARIDFDLRSREGVGRFRAFVEEAAHLVVSYGGSLSGEHGDGQARGELLGRMYGEELVEAFRAFKAIWDPEARMNPGKLVDPRPLDADLRLAAHRPVQVSTRFRFPEDGGSLDRASLRCVGVGRCRRLEGGTMCPSFMVTREEMHSTRGRARLLYEMLQGEVLEGGWRDPHLKEALDLCLACKGCKADCPVQVDVATYKAEFLHHYYRRRLRPPFAYATGLIHWWLRLGARLGPLPRALLAVPGVERLLKQAAGVAPARRLPRPAPRTFRRWLSRREALPGTAGEEVLLWIDTFSEHFEPEVARAAVAVLEHAGFRVRVPEAGLCCGRPLYDHGMLGLASHQLRRILAALGPALRDGIPVVGLEPSCVAVFRDELPGLFPDDRNARLLTEGSFTLGGFLHARGWRPPPLPGRVLLQGHCHQEAVMDLEGERALLEALGAETEEPEPGCCGMAGAFGFEPEAYPVSMACGERALLPAVRAAHPETRMVADGFSCREQIRQGTDRRPLHLAQLLAMAIERSRSRLT